MESAIIDFSSIKKNRGDTVIFSYDNLHFYYNDDGLDDLLGIRVIYEWNNQIDTFLKENNVEFKVVENGCSCSSHPQKIA